ncbi:conserved membrane hypothetical protein [Mesorhizobium sp. SOD10]|nr:conserved membrane hypothetical protein [Mesorhizobium sp. SOD10]
MSSVVLGGIVFLCLFGAALFGMLLRPRLPEHHLSTDSKDTIRLATAIVGTLSALALGLLIASAKSDYDDADAELRTSVGHVVLLDRVMAHYGPETQEARRLLRKLVVARLNQTWTNTDDQGSADDASVFDAGVEPVQDLLRALSPGTDGQRWLQSRALEVSGQIAEAHWMHMDAGSEGLPWPFVTILVFWLAVLFATFGLLAPRNMTVGLTLFICALSVAGAVFLIVDMANPYLGLIYIGDAPLRSALVQLGR